MPGADFAVAHDFILQHSGERLKISCAVDGSRVSLKALDLAIGLFQKDRGDVLNIIHVDDKKPKPGNLNVQAIQNDCKLIADKAQVPMEFLVTPKDEELGFVGTIIDKAEVVDTELLIVGGTGIRGERAGETNIQVLGSVSDGSLRRTEMSVAVVKSTSYEIEEKKTIMLATDNSPSAQVAFALILNKLVKPGDKVIVAYASSVVGYSTLLEDYEEELKERGVEHETAFLTATTSERIADVLMDFAKQKSADVLVLGTNGYTGVKLGSVSDACVKQSRCTTIVVKDPRDMEDHAGPEELEI